MSPTRYILRLDVDYINNYLTLFNTPDFNQSTLWDCVLEYSSCVDYSLDKESFLDAMMEYFNEIMTRHPRFNNNSEYFVEKFIEAITRIGDYITPILRHILNTSYFHRVVYVHYYSLTGELILDFVQPFV